MKHENARCALQSSAVLQIVVDDATTEALEADNLILQNMSSSKYVQVIFYTHSRCYNLQHSNSCLTLMFSPNNWGELLV